MRTESPSHLFSVRELPFVCGFVRRGEASGSFGFEVGFVFVALTKLTLNYLEILRTFNKIQSRGWFSTDLWKTEETGPNYLIISKNYPQDLVNFLWAVGH